MTRFDLWQVDRNGSVPVLSLGNKRPCVSLLVLVHFCYLHEESFPWLPLPFYPGAQNEHVRGQSCPY